MKQLNQIDAAYIAGFIDGEGSIAIHRQRNSNTRTGYAYRCGVRAANIYEAPLRWMQRVTGVGSVHSQQAKMRNSRICWNWSLWGDDAADLMRVLWPSLRVKQQQASLLLIFQQRIRGCGGNLSAADWEFREQCYHESRRMNHRGIEPYAHARLGFDVGEIAKQYGGGGHKHASGFRVPFDQLEQFVP